MQSADVLFTILRERGKHGLPLERVYRMLFNPTLYYRAYSKLAPNKGAMTQGSTPETVDGMSLVKIERLIAALRAERYRWTPVRRHYIAKKHSTKKRPLGIPMWVAYCPPYQRFWGCGNGRRPEYPALSVYSAVVSLMGDESSVAVQVCAV